LAEHPTSTKAAREKSPILIECVIAIRL